MKKLFSTKNENGQGLVEYAIILALVAIVVILAMGSLGTKIKIEMGGITASLHTDQASCEAAGHHWGTGDTGTGCRYIVSESDAKKAGLIE